MKIVYAADDRLGAAHQLRDFVKNTSHQVKVAAYPSSGRLLPFIDWNLSAAIANQAQLQKDIEIYYPDFVLIDGEPIIANIAEKLGLPILYCSTLHLLDGLVWKRGEKQYSATIEKLRRKLSILPAGVAKLIYSPFGDLKSSIEIKDDFEWIQPYHVQVESTMKNISLSVIEDAKRKNALDSILQSCNKVDVVSITTEDDSYLSSLANAGNIITDGNTRLISDGIYNNKSLFVCPKIKDPENLLNAILCANTNLAIDLGQVELAGYLAVAKIERANESSLILSKIIKQHKKLHERINELWECM